MAPMTPALAAGFPPPPVINTLPLWPLGLAWTTATSRPCSRTFAASSRTGTTGTPGHISSANFSIGFRIRGVSGVGAAAGPRTSGIVTFTVGSAPSLTSWARTSRDTPGKMRQLMFAVALWGKALVAWPAESMVATRVVRSMACQFRSRSSTATEVALSGFLTRAAMAMPALLALELEDLKASEFDLSLTGFDDEELARLLADEEAGDGLTDEGAVPDVAEAPVTLPGDLWRLSRDRSE